MRPGIPTLIATLLLLASLAYAPTWAVIVLAVLAVAAAGVDITRYRTTRTR